MPESAQHPSPRISLVAALARNRVIGRGNAIPWHLPEDLKRFKRITLGHAVIMGRKTFDSIMEALGKPLPGRRNIVISRSGPGAAAQTDAQKLPQEGVVICRSLDEALEAAKDSTEVFVIGGAQIYALALARADRLHLTEIDADIEGDTLFPEIDPAQFSESSREAGPASEFHYDFVIYDRRRN